MSARISYAYPLILLISCTPAATVARQDGFNAQWRAFTLIDAPPAYAETEIRVKVVVVGNMADIGYPGAAATYSAGGTDDGTIRIIGKLVNGKIVVPQSVLGHEIIHALQYQGVGFADPDKMEELEK